MAKVQAMFIKMTENKFRNMLAVYVSLVGTGPHKQTTFTPKVYWIQFDPLVIIHFYNPGFNIYLTSN